MTADQVEFLARNNITQSDVFDATGLKKQQYQAQMKREGKVLAIGVAPCNKEGHSMRTAYGHCAMCDPKKIRFQERFREDAFVYVASPQSNNQVVKIGFTKNVQGRATSLSNENYGGYSDWVIIGAVHSANAGRLENQAHTHFKENRLAATYFKDGAIQDARELFNCPPSVALDVILKFSANEPSSSELASQVKLTTTHEPQALELSKTNDAPSRIHETSSDNAHGFASAIPQEKSMVVQDKSTVKQAKITKKPTKKQSEMTKNGAVSTRFQQRSPDSYLKQERTCHLETTNHKENEKELPIQEPNADSGIKWWHLVILFMIIKGIIGTLKLLG